jgi:serine/threonine protein kinase
MDDHPVTENGQRPPEIPDFDLIRPIGEGGFGQVWLAVNRATKRLRAVKVIPLRISGTRDRAGREINSLVRLEDNVKRKHPNLLTIHHVARTDEFLYYLMDLADDISGEPATGDPSYRPATLSYRLQDGPLQADECLRVARQFLSGLASLHEARMVHRDVKPANCLFIDGELKLGDFGLLVEASPQVSRIGTAKYMPPDGRMDTRADVYAAGLVIYEMITGFPVDRFPSCGPRAADVIEDATLRALHQLVMRACEPDPKHRFQDARMMLVELEALISKRRPVPRRTRRRVILAATVAVCAVPLLGFWLGHLRTVHVNFVTEPFEATVYLDGDLQRDADGNPYHTPCTIDDLPPRVHHVEFRFPDRPSLDAGPYDFAQVRRVETSWPAAR